MVRYLGQKDKKLSVPTLERRFYGIPVGVRIRPRALSSKNLPAQGSICFKSQNFSPPTDFFEVQQFSHTQEMVTLLPSWRRGVCTCVLKNFALFLFSSVRKKKNFPVVSLCSWSFLASPNGQICRENFHSSLSREKTFFSSPKF